MMVAKDSDPVTTDNQSRTSPVTTIPVGHHNLAPVYAFSSMFYTKLCEKRPRGENGERRTQHSNVKRWTKNVDLFSKDFIFIPINIGAHWSLICVVRPGALITDYESPEVTYYSDMDSALVTVMSDDAVYDYRENARAFATCECNYRNRVLTRECLQSRLYPLHGFSQST